MSEGEESLFAELRLTGSSAWNKLHGDVTARLTGIAGRRDAADHGDPRPGDPWRRRGPPARLCRRADGVGVRRRDAGRLPSMPSKARPTPSTAAGAGPTRSSRPCTPTASSAPPWKPCRRPQWRRFPPSAVSCWPRPVCSAMAARCRGGTCSHRCRANPVWPGTRRPRRWSGRSAPTPRSSPVSPIGPCRVGGWTPSREKPSAAAPSACRCGATSRRVLLNFDGSFDSVQTLAHELGHAYHNANLAGRTAMQRRTPMAMAETASIFCETIMVQAGLAAAGDGERLAPAQRGPARRLPGRGRHPQPLSLRAGGVDQEGERDPAVRRAVRADAGRPAGHLRRRSRPLHAAPVHVGGETALLLQRLSTTGRIASACCSARASTPATRTTRTGFGPDTTTCCRRPVWRRRPSWRPASTSTSRRSTSGRPASRVIGDRIDAFERLVDAGRRTA